MSDSTDKKGPHTPGSGFPGGGDDNDLLAEFDAWDKNLDSLFEEESTADSVASSSDFGSISATHVLPDPVVLAADEFESSLDFLDESGELDSLFNDTPPPLPPVEEPPTADADDHDGIITSAARPALSSQPPRPVAAPAMEPLAQATDPGALGPGSGPAAGDDFGPGEHADAGGDFDAATRILDADDPLFAATVRTSSSPQLRPPTLPPLVTARRTASIVRRTELERMRAQRDGDTPEEDDDDGDFGFGAEATRIADAHQLESLMETAAAQPSLADAPAEPEISLVLDDEFYDDIEIGESAGEAEERKPKQGQRRVSRHLLRRTPVTRTEPPRPREQPSSVQTPERGQEERPGGLAIEPDDDAMALALMPEIVAGRDVDPEMTLDFRVTDREVSPDGEGYGDDLDDPFDVPTTARASAEISGSSAVAAATSFDDATTNVPGLPAESEADGDKEATRVHWSPADHAPREHAFLDLEPSPRDTGGHPPQRPSRIDNRSLPFLESATDFNEVPTVDPVPDVSARTHTEHEITSVRDSRPARADDDRAARADTPVFAPPRVTDADPADSEAPAPRADMRARAATPEQQAGPAHAPSTAEPSAVNATYDLGLPAVVPETRPAPAVQSPLLSPEAQATAASTPAALEAPDRPASAEPRRPSAFADPAVAGDDSWPALPPPVLPDQLLGMDSAALAAIDVPERLSSEAVEDAHYAEKLAAELLLYERELESDEFGRWAKELRLEAGRLCEQLGDLDRARLHFEEALGHDPLLGPALRGLRRIERVSGDWNAALNYLDAELEDASPLERRALLAHKADVLMAAGEQDLARVVVGERLDEEPDNVRALLANLELAFVDDRDDEFDATLDRLATALASPELVSCMHLLRGRLSERPVGQPSGDLAAAMAAYAKAAEAGSTDALVSMAMAAQQLGDLEAATAAIGRLAGTELEARDPDYVAALEWRRARWARLAGDHDGERNALTRAAALGQPEPLILADLAEIERARGDSEAAARTLARLVEHAASPAERANADVRLAECLSTLGQDAEAAEALRRAAQDDPAHPVAANALEQVLEASGDIEALIELGRRAAESDPAGAVFERVRVAGRLVQAGQYQRAIEDLQAGRAAVPDSPALSDALLDALSAAGALEERLALLQELIDESGEMRDAEALLLQLASSADAYVSALGAQLEQVRADLGAASETSDGEPDGALIEAERDLMDRRDRAVTQALDVWNRVLERDPESADAYAAMTRLCAVLDQPDLLDDALARAQSAAHDVDYAVTLALARTALVLAEAEPDLPRVEDIAREAMELAPSDPRPLLVLLDLAVRQGRLLDAAMLLEERAASISDPEHAASLRYRSAVLLLGRADEPAQAIELLRSVVEIRPDFDAAKELLEVAHRRLGEPMAITPTRDGDPSAGGGLERVIRQAEAQLYQFGDPARALELLREAMRERPDDALLRHGLQAAARAAGEPEILAELALADLARAENAGDDAAKADAYEELAGIESELRGDAGSARRALESAAELSGARAPVLRALERMYAKDQLFAELFAVRGKQLDSLEFEVDHTAGHTAWRAALHADRARLASRIGRPVADILAEYRAIYEHDRRSRPALFQLEAEARTHGPSDVLAALEADIAQYFEGDERARAAFLTHSAEILSDLGQTDMAIERFREASVLSNGFAPALAGWRQAAITGQRFAEVAEAALREAELCAIDSERAALVHLAGVAAMDRAEAPETAMNAFEQVLALDPAHEDAFARLYTLYQTAGQHEQLARLLEQRLDIEEDPEALARIHRALADLLRTELADPERARQHLRAILELRPSDPGAIEVLSEIAWAEEAWDEAAETLIVRARMETDPEVQKDIFFRLGVIYVEHKPEPEWALESFKRVLAIDANHLKTLEYIARLGNETKDFQLALRACERLVELEQDIEAKVAHLHRMGQVFNDGLEDRVRAERMYRSALELAPESARALSALVDFFERGGDLRSMRVHLDRVLGTMRAQLMASPPSGSVYRVLARALAARERAGVPGSLAAARCAAELSLLAEPDNQEESDLARAADARPPIARLCQSDIDDLLFPTVVTNAARQIFSLLGDRVAKHVGIDLRRYGVGRADRLKGHEHPIERVAEEMAADMGMEAPALYVSSKETRLLVVEPTQPISVVVSADMLEGADTAQLAFALGRSMKLAHSGFAVPARMNLDEFGVLMVSLLRLFETDFGALGVDGEAVATQQQRLRRLIPNSLIQQLRPFAISMAGPDFDYRALYRGIHEAGNRAGLLACGSARAAAHTLAMLHGLSSAAAALVDPEINALMQFAVSDDYASLCGQLAGQPGGPPSG